MNDLARFIYRSLCSIFDNVYATMCGLFTASLGYFLPVKNVVHLLIIFFIIDVLFGYLKSHKLFKKKFSTTIIWETTIPRMMVSILLVLCAFSWDKTFGLEYISTYKTIGWFISGVILYSIMVNMYLVTNWKVIRDLIEVVKNCVKGKTGIDIEK